jgi:hypothetical protein
MPTVNDVPDHWIRPTAAGSVPSNLIFFDCESKVLSSIDGKSEIQGLRCGVAIAVRRENRAWVRRDVLRFTDPLTFWLWLQPRLQPRKPLWCFAHNLAVDSTWVGLWETVDSGGLKLSVPCPACGQFSKGKCKTHSHFKGACVVSDPPIILVFRARQGIIKFVDTLNYFKCSVEKLGLALNLEKLPKPDLAAGEQEWFEYCQRDVEVIERAMCGFIDEWEANDCGHFATTAAGLAWSAFRRTIPPKTILIDHGEPHTGLERASYYGGQAEAYYVGKVPEPVTLLDVRSLYPDCMLGHQYPIKFLKMGTEFDTSTVIRKLQFFCAVASVTVSTERDGYPKKFAPDNTTAALLARTPAGSRWRFHCEKLGFPVGIYHTFLAGPELQRAIERNEVVSINAIAWYQGARIFDEFVNYWFGKRPQHVDAANYAKDLLYKTILNSMSGYFAKHKLRWIDRPDLRAQSRWGEWPVFHVQSGKYSKCRGIAGHVQELTEEGESRDSFAAIAAYITSYGREKMLFLRNVCPPRSVYYQDTDSLIVSSEGLCALDNAHLIGSGELGRLRMVDTLHNLTISGVKDYQSDEIRHIAGVKEKALPQTDGSWKQERWESLPEQWARTPDGSILVEWQRVALNRARMPRPVRPDGWTVPPRCDDSELVRAEVGF